MDFGTFVATALAVMLVSSVAGASRSTGTTVDSRLTHRYDKDHPADFEPHFSDRAAWEKHAEFLRRQVLVSQGLWPMPPRIELKPVIHGKVDRGAYIIEKVFFASLPGHYVTGNLYRPTGKSGKLPVVLCPYGHWPGGRFMWKSDADIAKDIAKGAETDRNAARSPLQANCAMLARMGCVVFQYDMVGYADSDPQFGGKIPHREGFTDVESVLRLQSFMGLQTFNSIRALDFVLSMPEVDPHRIGVAGSSGGGTQTIALGAVDPRPTVDFPMVMVSMNMQGGCVCENAPLYRIGTNNVELASLFAPKPEGMASANDWTHDFLTRGLPQMKSIWRLYGAADDVTDGYVNFGHNHNLHSRELQYNFLNQHLHLGWKSPVKEEPFEPVPPGQLSVYDADHPRPADETDAAGVREWMTRTSNEQLNDLAGHRDEYDKTVRAALEAMVVDQLPSAEEVEVVESATAVPPTAAGKFDFVLSRKGSGERVACRMIVPANWKRVVVIWADPHPNPPPEYRGRGLEENSSAVGGHSTGAMQSLLDHGDAVMVVDPFPAASPLTPKARHDKNPPYIGMDLCYNRCTLAQRVHDLLTAVAWARGWDQHGKLRLIAFPSAGPAGLLARALAGDAVDDASVDLAGFDFDQVHDPADPNLLPGGLKYGGVYGIMRLCANGHTQIFGAPKSRWSKLADGVAGLTTTSQSPTAAELVDSLMKEASAP